MNSHQRSPLPLAALLLSATALTACRGEPTAAAPAATHDSAGVEIITSVRPLWDSLPAWSIDSVPALTIGRTEGPDEYLFSWVTAAFGRDDGSIVVFDRGSSSFRAYDSTGTYLGAAGRKGPGPGEVRGVEGIARCGRDAVWVQAQQRISIWGTDLTFRREFSYPDNRMWPLICFGGTALLVKEDVHRPGEDPENVIYDDSLHLRVLDSLGGARRELLTARLWSYINIRKGGLGFPHPFGSQLLLGQHGSSLIFGPADELGFRSYASDGRLLRIVRGPVEPLEVTSAVKEAYLKAELTDREALELRTALALLDYPMPRTFPAYTALQVDTEGNVWLRRFEIPGTPERRWAVFRADGRFLGHLTMPPDIEVLEIGDDYLLARGTGPDDEPQVRRYRVRK